jgi:SAM-dependent methyltransferase
VFVEEARWLRNALETLDLRPGCRVLDIGSQSIQFRTQLQPFVERDVHAPLRARGLAITHLDAQPGDGIDVIADVASAEFDRRGFDPYDLVLATNLLEHVVDRGATIRNLTSLTIRGGYLVITVPKRFPYHADPIDTLYRPSVARLSRDVTAVESAMSKVKTAVVGVRSPASYVSAKAKGRRFFPFLQWQTTCIVFHRSGA